MSKLSGHNALVTGASRGIGKAVAIRLADEGARVAVNYNQSEDEASSVVSEITSQGGVAIAIGNHRLSGSLNNGAGAEDLQADVGCCADVDFDYPP